MQPSRHVAFMTLILSCIFSCCAVFGVILLPSFLHIHNLTDASLPQAPSEQEMSPTEPVRLLFLGDVMLARGVEWQIGKYGLDYPLSEMTEYLSTPDLTIGNFEGTIREEKNQELDGFTFDTTPTITQMLAKSGVDIVSLSNNHSNNHGSAVVTYTRETLSSFGITPFGDPYTSADHVARVTVHNQTISFIGFHAFGEEPESILPTISAEKDAGNFTIVFAHWGNEYESTPSVAQTEAAHMFVDTGADAIIGAHPHVIQMYENYLGVPILYSLGNFLFDQDWSVPTQQGLTLGFDIDDESITMTFVPISIIKSHVTIMDPDDATEILAEHSLPATLKIARQEAQSAEVLQ